MTTPKRNTIARKIRKQPDIQRKFKAYRKLHKDSREGGRSHEAIWNREDLSPGEKLVLLKIGAAHDYRSHIFTSPVTLSLKYLCKKTSLKPSGVRKITKQLEAKGLLIVTRRKDAHGADVASHYQLTWKLFKDYIQAKYAKRLARIAAMPGGAPEPDPNNDGSGKRGTDQQSSEESTKPEQPGPGLRLVPSASMASPIWEPGAVSEWGGSLNWLGMVSNADASDQNETPACDDALSEGESAPSESVDNELPTRTDALNESVPPLSEGEGSDSEPLLSFSSSSSSSKEDLNPPISPLADAKGDSEKMERKRDWLKTAIDDPTVPTRRIQGQLLYLLKLTSHMYVLWKNHYDEDWKWRTSGFDSLNDLLASYYPPFLMKLMPMVGRIIDQRDGFKIKGSPDCDFWRQVFVKELKALNALHEFDGIVGIKCIGLNELVEHGMSHGLKVCGNQ